MSNFLQVKVPHEVRTVLQSWVTDFRNAPQDHPGHPGEWFVSEIARLAKASATMASISRLALSMLVDIAVDHVHTHLTQISDAHLRRKQGQIAGEALLILLWCDSVVDIRSLDTKAEVIFFDYQSDVTNGHGFPAQTEVQS